MWVSRYCALCPHIGVPPWKHTAAAGWPTLTRDIARYCSHFDGSETVGWDV